MPKKIVVITGSPRKNGNSFAMTDAFIKAAEERGHTITRFDAALMNVSGCYACETCFKTGRACSFDDNFNRMAPVIQEADGVVFSAPIYWYTMPAQIKAVIDKMFSFYTAGIDLSGKDCAVISCFGDTDTAVIDGFRIPFERTAALLNWRIVGEVFIPGVLNIGDIDKTDGCEQATALADKF